MCSSGNCMQCSLGCQTDLRLQGYCSALLLLMGGVQKLTTLAGS